MSEMKRSTAINILKNRGLLTRGATQDVPVTNVSFVNAEGQPFVWEEGDNKGEPYAIVNFNAFNAYGKKQAEELFAQGEFQEACNTNLSARVPVKKGKELNNALYATVVMDEREIDVKDENGEPTGEKEMALLPTKVVPKQLDSFADKKVEFNFGETEEDNSNVPTGGRETAKQP